MPNTTGGAGATGNLSGMPFGPEHQAPAIRDLLAGNGRSFSFEFMPPKTEMGERQLWRAIRRLEPLRPTFVSVTYGAGGSTRERTVRVTGRIVGETTLTPAGHITAVNHSVAELRRLVGSYAAVGVRNMVARSEEHTSELQSHVNLVCRLLLEKKNDTKYMRRPT